MSMSEEVRQLFEGAKKDYHEIGGLKSFRSGQWLFEIIQRSFKVYWENANVEYFEAKYGTSDKLKIARKLTSVTARNAAILGSITGLAVSADELVTFFTAAEGGIGLPANIAIAATAAGAEAILLVKFQLQLVANLAKLKGIPLDPEDPEDILVILAYALGGAASEAAGKVGVKVGGKLAGRAAKKVFSKELLATLKKLAAKVGIKLLQSSIIKYTIPLASIAIGSSWNYWAIRSVAKIADIHFEGRLRDINSKT